MDVPGAPAALFLAGAAEIRAVGVIPTEEGRTMVLYWRMLSW
ncbi:hypothetical protein AB0D12_39500 [Streptomyces sp. NPDC048479]